MPSSQSYLNQEPANNWQVSLLKKWKKNENFESAEVWNSGKQTKEEEIDKNYRSQGPICQGSVNLGLLP